LAQQKDTTKVPQLAPCWVAAKVQTKVDWRVLQLVSKWVQRMAAGKVTWKARRKVFGSVQLKEKHWVSAMAPRWENERERQWAPERVQTMDPSLETAREFG
jgi:hypothetical protein